jgi:hypothetical protein
MSKNIEDRTLGELVSGLINLYINPIKSDQAVSCDEHVRAVKSRKKEMENIYSELDQREQKYLAK